MAEVIRSEPVGVQELAAELGMSGSLLHHHLERLEIPVRRLGRKAFVYEHEVADIVLRLQGVRRRKRVKK